MQLRFLLGPAGSGKTFCCLADIRKELLASPDGPPLILLAPKQATFQLERQLLADPALRGYTRLQILSFDRLAQFVLDELNATPANLLSEEGRVMVLRALLIQHQSELKIFRAAARLTGFAQQLSLLLREFQQHHLPPDRLVQLAGRPDATPQLRDKLHDLALLARAYDEWLKTHQLQDNNSLLDTATTVLRKKFETRTSKLEISNLWLDGFAEMTPQELDLLAALAPRCQQATLAFCLPHHFDDEPSWLSNWSTIARTYLRVRDRLESVDGAQVSVEKLKNVAGKGRFAANEALRCLEAAWSGSSTLSSIQHSASSIHLRLCSDPETEAILAAREILQHVRGGGRYRECGVVVRTLDHCHATLARVFRRYDIPFFMDRREPVSHHPLTELTRFALRTVAFGWRHDDWFGALKSGLAPAYENEIDALENAALAYGWEGRAWREPLPTREDAPTHEQLEKIRRRLVPPFEKLAAAVSSKPTGKQLAEAVRELWQALKVQESLDQWSLAEAELLTLGTRHPALHSTVLEQMQAWLDNVALAFPTESLPLREWLPILEAGLVNLTVGVIPPALDQVLVGAVDRSRNPNLKLALVLGLNEGIFPAPPAHGTLLTDADRSILERQKILLNPTPRQRLGQERYLGYIACTRPSERLVLTCAARDDKGQPLNPSPFFDHVQQITGVEVEVFTGSENWWESEHASELASPVLRAHAKALTPALSRPTGEGEASDIIRDPQPAKGSTDSSATASGDVAANEGTPQSQPLLSPLPGGEGKGEGQRNDQTRTSSNPASGRKPNKSLLSLGELPVLALLVEKWQQVQAAVQNNPLAPSTVDKIYGRELATSVSALEEFAACPFKFFASRGLRLEERKEFQFDVRDKGSLQHEILEKLHQRILSSNRRWRDVPSVEMRELITEIGRALLTDYGGGRFLANAGAQFTGELLIERLQRLMTVVLDWMPQYGFDPKEVEISFGMDDKGFPAWKLELPDGRGLLLRGRIDRVDICRLDDNTALAVVMDYKSSVRSLHNTKLHHGLELQLLSYLGVLRHLSNPQEFLGFKQLVPAGVFYVPLNGGRGGFNTTRQETLVGGDVIRRTAYQHSGRFLADMLPHFDNRSLAKGDQFKFSRNKDGTFSLRGNEAVPGGEFEALREKVENHLRDYAQRIFSGEIKVSPFRIGREVACDRCDFRAVCRFDPWTQPFRQLAPPPKVQKELSKK